MESEALFAKEILISQTGDLKEACQSFLTELDRFYSKYLIKMTALEWEWEKKFNNGNFDNVYFYPEKLSIKSPLTIIDAPWGTGKTYFVESLAKFFINIDSKNTISKIDKKQFQNIVIIDVWQHVNSDNVPDDISKELANVLGRFLDTNEKNEIKKSEWFRKGKKWVQNNGLTLIAMLLHCFGVSIPIEIWNSKKNYSKDQNNIENKQAYQTLLKKIDSKLKPTLVIFDNIERMGYHAIEIIKTIQQLSILKKFIFIIPMNKNQLTLGHKNDLLSGETAIDKYISLGTFFVLKWNYIGLLKSVKCPEEYCGIIDDILKTPIANQKQLSIRTLENCLNKFSVIKAFKKGKYEGLSVLKQIWNPIKKIDSIISEDINYFFEITNEMVKQYNKDIPFKKIKLLNDIVLLINQGLSGNIYIPNYPYYDAKNKVCIFFQNFINEWSKYRNKIELSISKIFKIINDFKAGKYKNFAFTWNWRNMFDKLTNSKNLSDIAEIINDLANFVNNSYYYDFYEKYDINFTIVDLAHDLVNDDKNEELTPEKLRQKLRQMYPNLLEVN